MTVLAGKDAANLTMSLDLSSMLELLESLVEDSIPAEYRAQLAKFSAEAILSDKAYIKSPLLDAMSESKSGTWYALGELNYSELYQRPFPPRLRLRLPQPLVTCSMPMMRRATPTTSLLPGKAAPPPHSSSS